MVEGPGCKLKGEKIRGKICGQNVVKVTGNAVECQNKPGIGKIGKEKKQTLLALQGSRLEEVQTLGKELFMYFGRICLRVHFLMDGSFRINNKQADPDSSSKKSKTPVLVLHMTKDSLSFFDSAVEVRCSSVCREKHEDLKTLDICSPVFSHRRAVELIVSQTPSRTLCDILLDQSILPGVGNIIKNEALFDSGIKPDAKVGELKEELISHIVKMTRDFSMLFYQCRKTGEALSKYYKVYGQDICKQCKTKVVICRMGEVNERMTYFCPTCQTNNTNSLKHRLPKKNSLLGWLGQGSTSPSVEWTCSACTLMNPGSQKFCTVCLTPRDGKNASRPQLPNLSRGISPAPESDCTLQQKTAVKRKSDSAGFLTAPNPSKRRKSDGATGAKENLSANLTSDGTALVDEKHKIPVCVGHKKKCSMREVRKEGANFRRMFFTCSLPRGKQCQHFQWADDSFPICPGHGKPGALRTVLKQGPNNGRKFFACIMPKTKQCDFFQWAEGYG